MPTEQLKAFQEAVKVDTALQEKLLEVERAQLQQSQGADAVVAIAKEAGFVISRDDLSTLDFSDLGSFFDFSATIIAIQILVDKAAEDGEKPQPRSRNGL
jgi:predicted ribosomally synthesized peptide with nif11-like leader